MSTKFEMNTAMSLKGQVALVTGGGTGIGLNIAKAFASNGAKVYISGRREEVLHKAAEGFESIVPLVLDVNNASSIAQAVERIQTADGRLDILVNNAGIAGPADPSFYMTKMQNFAEKKDSLELETPEIISAVFETNVVAPLQMVRAFTALLVKGAEARAPWGTSSVINISSGASVIKTLGAAMSIAYGASKAALDRVTTALAADFAVRKVPIRVNSLLPGMFASELNTLVTEENPVVTDPMPGFAAPTPAGRGGSAEEMAMSAMYLAASGYTNGAMVIVDGGLGLVNA